MPPGQGFAGRLSSAPNSLARSLEAGGGGGGVDEAASLARARLQLQQRQLRATEQYRHEHRQERLTQLLQGSAQLTRYIYPHYGSVEFVELPFRNPYSTEHAFTVVWDDPMGHLSLVTSLDEWRALKARHKLSTNPNPDRNPDPSPDPSPDPDPDHDPSPDPNPDPDPRRATSCRRPRRRSLCCRGSGCG